jgi:DNA-binding transcriptional LysR family regulator
LEGQRLAAELQKGFDTLEAALSKAIAQQTHSLDVGCLPSFATRTLIPRLHRLYALAPSVEVKIVTNQRRLQLEQSRYDVQIMALPPQKKRQANDVLLMTERLGLVLSPALNARQSGCENLLANISLLLARSRLDVWAELQAASALPLGSYQGTVEYEHYHFVLDAVLAGLGFCIAPQHLVEQDLHSGRLLAPFGFYDSGYVYVARHSAQPSPAVMQFCTWLKTDLEDLTTERLEHDDGGVLGFLYARHPRA